MLNFFKMCKFDKKYKNYGHLKKKELINKNLLCSLLHYLFHWYLKSHVPNWPCSHTYRKHRCLLYIFVAQYIMKTVLDIKIWIYWSESNSWINFTLIFFYKNWKIFLVQTKFYWSWAWWLVLIVRTVKKSFIL